MASRKFFVGGNWKCNGTSDSVKKIVIVLNEAEVPSEDVVEVVVSPPFVFFAQVKGLLRPDFAVAAQIFWVRKGGDFTVEIRCHGSFWVTLNGGHCWVNQMICTYALSQGLKVIACIGETLEQRESGPTMEVISAQTKAIAGSVNGGNCKELAAQPDVDGFLVGGASLKPEFVDIIKSATVKSTSA